MVVEACVSYDEVSERSLLPDGHRTAWLSAETYRELIGAQDFIQDEYVAQKNKNRRQFGAFVRSGLTKAVDASMFHGLARTGEVKYRNEEF